MFIDLWRRLRDVFSTANGEPPPPLDSPRAAYSLRVKALAAQTDVYHLDDAPEPEAMRVARGLARASGPGTVVSVCAGGVPLCHWSAAFEAGADVEAVAASDWCRLYGHGSEDKGQA